MVLEIIGAAIMIAFGFLAIYFSVEDKFNDSHMFAVLIIGLILIIGGGWVIATHISLAVLLAKIAGIIFAFFGFFLIWGFPDVRDYQPENMGKTGVFFGVILFIIGVYLLLFFA
jgi:hypothetical protein